MNRLSNGIVLTGAFVIWVTMPTVQAGAADVTNPPALPVLDWEPRSDWISVKAHGAKGDGTTDDTVAIQTALNTIKRGVTIHFPPGIYRVTRTLAIANPNEKALYGVLIVGHGRDTRLIWDGPSGGTLIQAEGMAYSRWVGMELDGAGKAAVAQHHFSRHTFETVHRKRHMAFRGFTKAAVLAAPDDKFAMAETSFENCLFENCAVGVSFTQFNDYNITFDGCEFRACGTGILCAHGSFYARNCHFEGSRVTDIVARPEHGSSVRRCTSLGSKMFLEHANSVAGMTVEGCSVSGWEDPLGAVSISGAPVMIFDCTFTDPPPNGTCAVRIRSHHQRLISSQNTVPDGLPLLNADARKRVNVRIREIPAGKRKGVVLSARRQFLKSEVGIPGKVFDAKRDFGAKGDGTTDDSVAIQKAIDAARTRGQGAIAYLPAGRYMVTKTLRVTGGDYYVGGAGMLSTHLAWRGEPNGTTIAVDAPDGVTIEHLDLQKKTGIDILQTGDGQPSFVVYDGLFVSRYNDPPFAGGIRCQQLDKKATVLIPCLAGTLHMIDSAQATVLVPLSYYGSIVVRGEDRRRDGILGVQSRFSGGNYNVVVEDNHSMVMSDYYSENSGNIFLLQGGADDPPGRVTIQGAKLHLNEKRATNVFDIRNYAGQVFVGPHQFNGSQAGRISLNGDRPLDFFLMANCFYKPALQVSKSDTARVYLLGNLPVVVDSLPADQVRALFADSLPADRLTDLSKPLDDLRRLGETDLKLNHPSVFIENGDHGL